MFFLYKDTSWPTLYILDLRLSLRQAYKMMCPWPTIYILYSWPWTHHVICLSQSYSGKHKCKNTTEHGQGLILKDFNLKDISAINLQNIMTTVTLPDEVREGRQALRERKVIGQC